MSDFSTLIARAEALLARLEAVLPQPPAAPDWSASIAFRYRRRGTGGGVLEPVRHVAPLRLADLKEVDGQKERLVRNTAQFVAGRPANNVLLTGARGTGKSSLIKACLNEFADRGLRLIEVDKDDLTDLPGLCRAGGLSGGAFQAREAAGVEGNHALFVGGHYQGAGRAVGAGDDAGFAEAGGFVGFFIKL